MTVPPTSQPAADANASVLRSIHTQSFPQLLGQLGVSLAVSTYQAGQLVTMRAGADGKLNTHFHGFARPMGVAVNGQRLCVGSKHSIHDFWNMPAASARLDPPNVADAVYALRNVHVTGAIDIHEMAFSGNELWYVNTAFSCLCVLSQDYGFDPRWRPPFVSGYSPQDRCHLNGLAMENGKPRFVTALGESDEHQGWRKNKRDGGILVDVPSGEVVARGLSMPHSPRIHGGKPWLLESGRGGVCSVDLATGRVETLCRLPGFTRGFDFAGPVAFIGLSQVRDTNTFVDIPIVDENPERQSGVWAIDWRTGETLGFVRFEDQVQEIFSVSVIPNARWPELLDEGSDILDTLYALPDDVLKDVRFVPEGEAAKQ